MVPVLQDKLQRNGEANDLPHSTRRFCAKHVSPMARTADDTGARNPIHHQPTIDHQEASIDRDASRSSADRSLKVLRYARIPPDATVQI